jgi:hypothetical protein
VGEKSTFWTDTEKVQSMKGIVLRMNFAHEVEAWRIGKRAGLRPTDTN